MEGATAVLFGGQGPHGRLRTYRNLRFLSKWEASEMPATRGKHPQESGRSFTVKSRLKFKAVNHVFETFSLS
jgi:hypothetical protein